MRRFWNRKTYKLLNFLHDKAYKMWHRDGTALVYWVPDTRSRREIRQDRRAEEITRLTQALLPKSKRRY